MKGKWSFSHIVAGGNQSIRTDRVEEFDEGVEDVLLDIGHDERELGKALGEG